MQKHIQHYKDERTQFSRKLSISLYWKDCVWEVSWRLNKTSTYWPHPAPLAIAVRLFRSPGLLNRGLEDQPLRWELVLTARSGTSLRALNSDCLTSCLTRVISLFYVHSIQPVDSQGYPVISSTGHICYLHWCISHLTAWSGRMSICNTTSYSFSTFQSADISIHVRLIFYDLTIFSYLRKIRPFTSAYFRHCSSLFYPSIRFLSSPVPLSSLLFSLFFSFFPLLTFFFAFLFFHFILFLICRISWWLHLLYIITLHSHMIFLENRMLIYRLNG